MILRLVTTFVERLADGLLRLRNRHFFAIDVFALLLTPALALMLRTDSSTSVNEFGTSVIVVSLAFLLVKLVLFYAAGLYNRYWQYASIDELAKITVTVGVATAMQALLFFVVLRPLAGVSLDFPRSVPFIDGLLTLLVVGGSRYSVRFAQRLRQRVQVNGGDGKNQRVLVVGAGEAGIMIVEEMRSNPHLGLHPVAFVDDNPDKYRMRIRGLTVMGGRDAIPRLIHEMGTDLVVIAIPTASGKAVREIAEICKRADVATKIVPGVYELLDGKASIRAMRDVQVEDLLRRPLVETDMTQVKALLQNSRVLVTGGGGSIGSELCRQILALQPAEVLLLGHGENSIFRIEAELQRRLAQQPRGPKPLIHPVIADIRDRCRLEQVFAAFRPQVVFHAAAHKHVPLMEANVEEAVSNNIEGTRNLLEMAIAFDIERFILISTDKAVNPTSIMGATKRVAELLVRDTAAQSGRPYLAVRFGNVLGSRGSVLEVFRDQIARGGPITVTHPDVRRYFMTIPEAVHLVLQAATMGRGSEVFLLDMGEPTRIIDLARDLIRLSGMEEGRDIDIVVTGLRPGEKLFEELYANDENLGETSHEKVLVCELAEEVPFAERWTEEDHARLQWEVDQLVEAARRGDTLQVVQRLSELVPDYREGKKQVLLERLQLETAEGEVLSENPSG